jgi:ATP-dependent DNA helicase RecQ
VLQVSSVRQGYRRARAVPDVGRLREAMSGRFLERERRDIDRVHWVLEYVEAEGCLTRRLLAHFGENLPADCGHCGRCLGQACEPLPPPQSRELGPSEAALRDRLRAELHAALASPRQMARFLCGLSSPATSRAKLTKHPDFGALADVPFARVLAFVS